MLPQAFKNRMKRIAPDEADALFSALENEEPCRALRVNLTKTTVEKFRKTFPQKLEALSFCDDGFLLSDAEGIGRRPEHHAGAIYLQDPGAMSTLNAVKLSHGWRCADLCAAPGGKSSQISSAIGDDGFLLANEYVPKRAKILVGNIERLGLKNTVVTSKDTEELAALYPESFDFVLADVPCSGEGMFRKDPGAIQEWNESNLQLCSERQQRILADIWPCLKPSGFLVYSTCTYNPGENEAILERLIRKYGARSIEIAPLFPGIVPGNSTAHCYHFYPHRIPGEGFFTGVVQKTEGEEFRAGKVRKNTKHTPPLLPGDIRAYIRTPEYYRPYAKDNIIGVIPEQHSEFIQLLEANLHILYQGCEIAEIINRKSKPLPSLALWQGLNKANCALLDTDRMTALTFLKKEDIPVPPKTAEWLLVTYRGQGLGWCKHLGNRLNNYYPKEWRIRMTIE